MMYSLINTGKERISERSLELDVRMLLKELVSDHLQGIAGATLGPLLGSVREEHVKIKVRAKSSRERTLGNTPLRVVPANEVVPGTSVVSVWRVRLAKLKAATNTSSVLVECLAERATATVGVLTEVTLTIPLKALSDDAIDAEAGAVRRISSKNILTNGILEGAGRLLATIEYFAHFQLRMRKITHISPRLSSL